MMIIVSLSPDQISTMASSGNVNDAVKSTLREYKERAETADAMKLTPFLKCMEACGLKQYKATTETSIWNLHADKRWDALFNFFFIRSAVPQLIERATPG